MTITTLAPEPTTFTDRGVSYVYADLRERTFRDGWFDSVVCTHDEGHVKQAWDRTVDFFKRHLGKG